MDDWIILQISCWKTCTLAPEIFFLTWFSFHPGLLIGTIPYAPDLSAATTRVNDPSQRFAVTVQYLEKAPTRALSTF